MIFQYINRKGKFKAKLKENERATLEEVGKFIKSKMDTYVPVDTGYLKSRNEWGIQQNELYVQNDCYYAKFQEYGTYKMRAQPFLRPAVFNHKKEIREISIKTMGRNIF